MREKNEFELLEYFNGLKGLDAAFVPQYFNGVDFDKRSTSDQQDNIRNAIDKLRGKKVYDTNQDAANAKAKAAAADAKAAAAAAAAPAPAPARAPPAPAPAWTTPRPKYKTDLNDNIEWPIQSDGKGIFFTQDMGRGPPMENKVKQLSRVNILDEPEKIYYVITEMSLDTSDVLPNVLYAKGESNIVKKVGTYNGLVPTDIKGLNID